VIFISWEFIIVTVFSAGTLIGTLKIYFNDMKHLEKKIDEKFKEYDDRLLQIEKCIAVIKDREDREDRK